MDLNEAYAFGGNVTTMEPQNVRDLAKSYTMYKIGSHDTCKVLYQTPK